jgi:uncharacterized protein HemX
MLVHGERCTVPNGEVASDEDEWEGLEPDPLDKSNPQLIENNMMNGQPISKQEQHQQKEDVMDDHTDRHGGNNLFLGLAAAVGAAAIGVAAVAFAGQNNNNNNNNNDNNDNHRERKARCSSRSSSTS